MFSKMKILGILNLGGFINDVTQKGGGSRIHFNDTMYKGECQKVLFKLQIERGSGKFTYFRGH